MKTEPRETLTPFRAMLPVSLHAQLRKAAFVRHISMAGLIREALTRHLTGKDEAAKSAKAPGGKPEAF